MPQLETRYARRSFTHSGDKRIEKERKKHEKELREAALAREWASLPVEHRISNGCVAFCVPLDAADDYKGPLTRSGKAKYDLNSIRKLEPDAHREAIRAAELQKDLEQGRKAARDLKILAEFLSAVPQDALRGTVKSLASTKERIEDIKREVEYASPVLIFQDDD